MNCYKRYSLLSSFGFTVSVISVIVHRNPFNLVQNYYIIIIIIMPFLNLVNKIFINCMLVKMFLQRAALYRLSTLALMQVPTA